MVSLQATVTVARVMPSYASCRMSWGGKIRVPCSLHQISQCQRFMQCDAVHNHGYHVHVGDQPCLAKERGRNWLVLHNDHVTPRHTTIAL